MKACLMRFFMPLLFLFFLTGCADLRIIPETADDRPLEGNRIAIFPFHDPSYNGQRIAGIGRPFAAVFTKKLRAAGLQAEFQNCDDFSPASATDIGMACRFASDNGYAMFATGTVTEWVDGATSWSGKVDVASVTVRLYSTETCQVLRAVSGRQQGAWFTLVDEPTTRFYEPLSESLVTGLLKR